VTQCAPHSTCLPTGRPRATSVQVGLRGSTPLGSTGSTASGWIAREHRHNTHDHLTVRVSCTESCVVDLHDDNHSKALEDAWRAVQPLVQRHNRRRAKRKAARKAARRAERQTERAERRNKRRADCLYARLMDSWAFHAMCDNDTFMCGNDTFMWEWEPGHSIELACHRTAHARPWF